MIDGKITKEIRQLLREGNLSQRRIAKNFGVSRSVVRLIAQKKEETPPPIHPFILPRGKPKRCPSCGGLVRMPCLACQVRALKKGHGIITEQGVK